MSEVQEKTPIVGPGQLLRTARQQAKLSVQDIAQKLHLNSSVITDIEDDNYDRNISMTFIKGYIKLYAKQVMVTEAEIVSAFETLNTQKKEPAKLHSFSRRVANQANDDKLMMVSYMILAVVLALVVVWWFQQSDNDVATTISRVAEQDYTSTEYKDEQVSEVLNSGIQQNNEGETDITIENDQTTVESMASLNTLQEQEANTLASAGAELEAISAPEQTNNELASEEVDSVVQNIQSSIAETNVVDQKAVALADSVQLVFEFSGDCWINLSDATDENIAYGVKTAGRVMTVSGVPPFTVTLGAPEVVKISYAGEAIDMSKFRAGYTAKFTLPITPQR